MSLGANIFGEAQLNTVVAADAPAWLQAARKAGMDHALACPMPGRCTEAWRYNQMRDVAEGAWTLAPEAHKVDRETLDNQLSQSEPAGRFVFVDGHYDAELSILPLAAKGMFCQALSACLKSGAVPSDMLQSAYTHINAESQFDGLNLALAQDGLFISLEDRTQFDGVLQLVNIDSGQGGCIAPLRHVINLEANGRLNLDVINLSLGEQPSLHLPAFNIACGSGAMLMLRTLSMGSNQLHALSSITAKLDAGSTLDAHQILLGGKQTREAWYLDLVGQSSQCKLSGVSLPLAEQEHDVHIFIQHHGVDAQSEQNYRTVAAGPATGIFHGGVHVHPTGSGAVARQSSRNLLLSQKAKMQTKPELVIETEDVVCSHGATVGFLDADAEFYLRARGLDLIQSQEILAGAFVSEVIDSLEECPWKEHITEQVRAKLSRLVNWTS